MSVALPPFGGALGLSAVPFPRPIWRAEAARTAVSRARAVWALPADRRARTISKASAVESDMLIDLRSSMRPRMSDLKDSSLISGLSEAHFW